MQFGRWTTVATITCLALLSSTFFACGTGSEPGGFASADPGPDGPLPVADLETRWASAHAESLEALIDHTGWAFVGRVVRLEETISVDLVPDDADATPAPTVAGKPIPANDGPPPLPVSIFAVHVDRVLLGAMAPGQTVQIRQLGGIHEQSDGSLIRVQFDGDQPLEPGSAYLFFTRPLAAGEAAQTSPFTRMSVLADGSFSALPGWGNLGAMRAIASMSGADAANTIVAAGEAR